MIETYQSQVWLGKFLYQQDLLQAIINFQLDPEQFAWNNFNDQFSISKRPNVYFSTKTSSDKIEQQWQGFIRGQNALLSPSSDQLFLNLQYCPTCDDGVFSHLMGTINDEQNLPAIVDQIKNQWRDYRIDHHIYQALNQAMVSHNKQCYYQKQLTNLNELCKQLDATKKQLRQWTRKDPVAIKNPIKDPQFATLMNDYWNLQWQVDYFKKWFNDTGQMLAKQIWKGQTGLKDHDPWKIQARVHSYDPTYQADHPIISWFKIFTNQDPKTLSPRGFESESEIARNDQAMRKWALQFDYNQWQAIKAIANQLLTSENLKAAIQGWLAQYGYEQGAFYKHKQQLDGLIRSLEQLNQGAYDQQVNLKNHRKWFGRS